MHIFGVGAYIWRGELVILSDLCNINVMDNDRLTRELDSKVVAI